MLAVRGRVEVEADTAIWVSRALAEERVEALPLDPEVAVAAGMLGSRLGGDLADRIIYATAVAVGAPLVTKDRRLRDFDPRSTLW
jgi:PIN domain nuclease of toxin-antitoxin system